MVACNVPFRSLGPTVSKDDLVQSSSSAAAASAVYFKHIVIAIFRARNLARAVHMTAHRHDVVELCVCVCVFLGYNLKEMERERNNRNS